jgi:5-formyltetrahydrofolate cyclo-ligase
MAYELQLIDHVPVQPWDQKVDYVITESRVIDCGAQLPREIAR